MSCSFVTKLLLMLKASHARLYDATCSYKCMISHVLHISNITLIKCKSEFNATEYELEKYFNGVNTGL